MGLPLYINTEAKSITNSILSQQSGGVPYQLPPFVIGDERDFDFYFVSANGALQSWSGSASYTLRVGAGNSGATPTAGTFRLSGSVGGEVAADIAFDATAATIEGILNANTLGGKSDWSVTKSHDGFYIAKAGTVGALTETITVVATDLVPESVGVVSETVVGDASTKSVIAIRLSAQPIIFQDTFTQLTDDESNPIGWRGTLSSNTNRVLQFLGKAASKATLLEIEVTDTASKRKTYAQVAIQIVNEVIDEASLTPDNLASFYTAAQVDSLLAGKIDKTEYIGRRKFAQVSTSTTLIANTHDVIEQTAAGITTSLWTIPTSGDCISIVNTSGGNTTISGNGNLIDTVSSITVSDGSTFDLIYNGVNWIVI